VVATPPTAAALAPDDATNAGSELALPPFEVAAAEPRAALFVNAMDMGRGRCAGGRERLGRVS